MIKNLLFDFIIFFVTAYMRKYPMHVKSAQGETGNKSWSKSKIFSPLSLSQKSCPPPFCFPPVKLQNSPPFFRDSPLIYNIQASHTQIFNLYITGFHKLTTNTLSTSVITCNNQEKKQVSKSELIFQIHKQTQFTIIYSTSGNS